MSRIAITIYTIPKPFTGLFRTIQLNAIRSWLELTDDIILFGREAGVKEIANRFGLRHVSNISTSKYDTPLMSGVVARAPRLAKHSILSFVNCDMILLPDFVEAIRIVKLDKYLIVGQRRPLDIDRQIVGIPLWKRKVERLLIRQNSRPITGGSDYFIYPKTVHFPMPPFAVGKLFWDSWFMWHARSSGVPIVNATQVITAIHQQHYRGFETHAYGELNLGEEAQTNLRLLGRRSYTLKVYDADYLLTKKGLVGHKMTFTRLIRRSEIGLMLLTHRYPQVLALLILVEKLRTWVTVIRKWGEKLTAAQ